MKNKIISKWIERISIPSEIKIEIANDKKNNKRTNGFILKSKYHSNTWIFNINW